MKLTHPQFTNKLYLLTYGEESILKVGGILVIIEVGNYGN